MKNQPSHGILIRRMILSLIAITLLFSGFNCAPKQSPVELVFAFGADESGTVQALIDKFNEEQKGAIKVTWSEGSRFSDVFYQELVTAFESGSPPFDVVGSDVIWTPAFATNKWVEDLTQRFFVDYEPLSFIDGAMESVSYNFKVWGLPWYTDAGMLYYRKDLLGKSGYHYPPATWEELTTYAKKIMADSGTKYGYVFQGANYEGGVTNACEFIWNADGNILVGDLYVPSSFDQEAPRPEIITVNSQPSRLGLQELKKVIGSGIVPPDITEYREREAATVFQQGEAVFMRSWASAYSYLLNEASKVKPEQVGLTMVPTLNRGLTPYSCLGGWNLMISAMSSDEKKEAAWKFIQFMSNEESQRYRALNAGILPSLRQLYNDNEFIKNAPAVEFAKQVIPICKERPKTPLYMQMSPEISSVYTQVIKDEVSIDEAVASLQTQLEEIIKQHQQ